MRINFENDNQSEMKKIKWEFTVFYVLTFVLTIFFAVGQQQLGIDYEKITIPQFAPSIAAFLTGLIFVSSKSFLNFRVEKSNIPKFLMAFVLPILVFGLGFFLCQLFGVKTTITENLAQSLPLALVGMLVGAIGEEIGWRSFLQPNLEKSNSVLLSSIITGLMWGFWHIGHYKNGLFFMLGFLLFAVSASVVLRRILAETSNNLLISVLFHFSINICFVVFYKNSLTDSNMILVNGALWAVVAIASFFIKSIEKQAIK